MILMMIKKTRGEKKLQKRGEGVYSNACSRWYYTTRQTGKGAVHTRLEGGVMCTNEEPKRKDEHSIRLEHRRKLSNL